MDRQIEIKNLIFSYVNGEKVLNGLDFKVEKGEFIGIVGGSGSGKSTLVKHFNGILRCDSGMVKIIDTVIDEKSRNLKELRKRVGLVFQFPDEQLFSDHAKEDIVFAPKKFQVSREIIEKNLENVKKIFKLTDEVIDRNYKVLSGGEKRRIAIASVAIMMPEILILDEPTIGLDYENKIALMRSLKMLNSKGVTIIIVSHDLDTIWDDINRIVLMEKGCIRFDGKKSDFLLNIDSLENGNKFIPHYIEILYNNGYLKGNEEKVNNREEALEILEREYKRWKND